MWNASRFCVSSLRRGHANLLCIVPILVYVLPKQVQLEWQKLAFYISVSTYFDDEVRLESKYKHPSHTGVEPRTLGLEVQRAILCAVGIPPIKRLKGNYFNACPDVMVPGSNPQRVFPSVRFFPPILSVGVVRGKKCGTLHDFACHPCAGAMLIFSVSFQF